MSGYWEFEKEHFQMRALSAREYECFPYPDCGSSSGEDEVMFDHDERHCMSGSVFEIDVRNPPFIGIVPELEQVTYFSRKVRCAAYLYTKAVETHYKGMLKDDLDGPDKRLAALAAAAERTRDGGRRPAIILAPRSLCQAWKSEAERSFQQGALPTVVLSEIPDMLPRDRSRFRVVVVSHEYLENKPDFIEAVGPRCGPLFIDRFDALSRDSFNLALRLRIQCECVVLMLEPSARLDNKYWREDGQRIVSMMRCGYHGLCEEDLEGETEDDEDGEEVEECFD